MQKYELPGIANLLWSSPDLENLIIDLVPSTCIYVSRAKLFMDFPLLFIYSSFSSQHLISVLK